MKIVFYLLLLLFYGKFVLGFHFKPFMYEKALKNIRQDDLNFRNFRESYDIIGENFDLPNLITEPQEDWSYNHLSRLNKKSGNRINNTPDSNL